MKYDNLPEYEAISTCRSCGETMPALLCEYHDCSFTGLINLLMIDITLILGVHF